MNDDIYKVLRDISAAIRNLNYFQSEIIRDTCSSNEHKNFGNLARLNIAIETMSKSSSTIMEMTNSIDGLNKVNKAHQDRMDDIFSKCYIYTEEEREADPEYCDVCADWSDFTDEEKEKIRNFAGEIWKNHDEDAD